MADDGIIPRISFNYPYDLDAPLSISNFLAEYRKDAQSVDGDNNHSLKQERVFEHFANIFPF